MEKDKLLKELQALDSRNYQFVSNKIGGAYREALVDILSGLAEDIDNYDAMSFSRKAEFQRQMKVANQVSDVYVALGEDNELNVKEYLKTIGGDSYMGLGYRLDKKYGIDVGNAIIDSNFLEALIEKPVAGLKLSKRLYNDVDKLAKRSTDAIRNGLIKGQSYDKIAGRLRDLNEASYNNAMRIVRTESGRVSAEATMKGYADAKDLGIHLEKEWLSSIDARTRKSHIDLDGQRVPVDGEFKINGHRALAPCLFGVAEEDINCRCTTVEHVVDAPDEVKVKPTEAETFAEYKEDKTGEKDKSNPFSDKAINKMEEAYSDEQLKIFREAYNPVNEDVTKAIDNFINSDVELLHHSVKGHENYTGGQNPTMLVNSSKPRTFYHEIGHGIDDLAHKHIDVGIHDFRVSVSDMVRKDLDNTIYKGTLAEKATLNKRTKIGKARYNEIWDEQQKYRKDFDKFLNDTRFDPDDLDSISDILGGAKFNITTRSTSWGHTDEYWKNETHLGDEAVAHIFSSVARQSKDMEILKKYLPDTFKFVETMLKKL